MEANAYEVIFYEISAGRCPTDDFLDAMQPKVKAKVEKWIQKLGEHGPNLPRPYADVLSGKIRELRIKFGSNQYRLLYFFHGKLIVITHGFVKKTDAVPVNEIHRAERYMNEFLNEEKGA